MLEIEIVEVNLFSGGVEVFARAWEDGDQIGFGEDGSIDIERFKMYNPPVLVSDATGDISRVNTVEVDGVEESYRNNFREDAEEAILQSLEETIKVIKNKIVGSSDIQANKRGNTTSTFYSDGGDACFVNNLSGGSFTADRNKSSSDSVATGSPQWGFVARNTVYLYRGYIPFDTSSIPDTDVVSSATFSVKPSGNYNNTCGMTAYIAPMAAADPTAPVTSDYGSITFTDYGNRVWSAASVGSYFDITMTAAGYGGVSKTSYTELALISDYDFLDTTPCNSSSTGGSQIHYSDSAGTTNDPKLVVEHSAGSPVSQSARRGVVMMM